MNFLTVGSFMLCALTLVSAGELNFTTTCESYNVSTASTNISSADITGKWYVRSTYGEKQNCSTYEISLSSNGSNPANYTVKYHHKEQVDLFSLIVPANSSNVTKHEGGEPKDTRIFTTSDTLVIWSCVPQDVTSSRQSLVVLSRNGSTLVNATMESLGFNKTELNPVDQTGCDNKSGNDNKSGTTMIQQSVLVLVVALALLQFQL